MSLPAATPFGSSKKTATTVSVVNARVNGSVVAWPGLMLLARAYRVYSMVALVSKTAPRQVHLTFQTATFQTVDNPTPYCISHGRNLTVPLRSRPPVLNPPDFHRLLTHRCTYIHTYRSS